MTYFVLKQSGDTVGPTIAVLLHQALKFKVVGRLEVGEGLLLRLSLLLSWFVCFKAVRNKEANRGKWEVMWSETISHIYQHLATGCTLCRSVSWSSGSTLNYIKVNRSISPDAFSLSIFFGFLSAITSACLPQQKAASRPKSGCLVLESEPWTSLSLNCHSCCK